MDPIFPYLFIMCMELLSRRIEYEVDLLNWTFIFISRRGPKISYVFFVGDLTLFAKADKGNCETIKKNLDSFSIFSGQKINRMKLKVIFSRNFPPLLASLLLQSTTFKPRTTLGRTWDFLNNIPNHVMQYISLPHKITYHIDRVQRSFIWGTTHLKRKMHLIIWDVTTST